ncbi:MAG: NUDIX hydrolase [Acidimicrobiales bacterium]
MDSTTSLLAATAAPAGREAMWAEALVLFNASHRDGVPLVANVLVVGAAGLVLLTRHRRSGPWGPLGEHLESGDQFPRRRGARTPRRGDARATRPATTIDVCLSPYRCRTSTAPVIHFDVLFSAVVAEPIPALVASDEPAELEWFENVLSSTHSPATALHIARATAAVRS